MDLLKGVFLELFDRVPARAGCGTVKFFCVRHMSMGSKQQTDDNVESRPKEIAELREEPALLRAERALAALKETRDG